MQLKHVVMLSLVAIGLSWGLSYLLHPYYNDIGIEKSKQAKQINRGGAICSILAQRTGCFLESL